MKKLLFTLFTLLTTLQGWGVAKQNYTEIPDYFPEAFEWEMTRDDYRGDEIVKTSIVNVIWEPDFARTVNNTTYYGRLTIIDFYERSEYFENPFNLVCINDGSFNFMWSEDGMICTFSFAPTSASTWNPGTITYPTNESKTYNYGVIAPSTPNSNQRWWADGTSCPYGYTGGQRDCVLNLDEKTITINSAWGCFMRNGQYGSSRTVDYYTKSVFREPEPTPLAWLENAANGVLNKNYTVADQLVGVYAQGGSLWCKDQGNISNVKSTNPGNTDYMKNLMFEMHGRNPSLEWGQSNWVELDFGEVTAERAEYIYNTYVGHTLKAGTVKGEYVDKTNYRIELSEDPEVDGDLDYAPNYYCPVNFMGATDVTGSNGKNFYFLNPKVQEYAYATVAVWKGDDVFVVPAKNDTQGVNGADLSGAFRVNWGLNCMEQNEIVPLLTNNDAYEFHAIIRKPTSRSANSPARIIESVTPKDVDPTNDFIVYPLDLTATGTQIVTGITTVRSNAVDDGYYYTITGQRVTNPTPGFYIRGGKKVIVR